MMPIIPTTQYVRYTVGDTTPAIFRRHATF